jgi:hypothetical protein
LKAIDITLETHFEFECSNESPVRDSLTACRLQAACWNGGVLTGHVWLPAWARRLWFASAPHHPLLHWAVPPLLPLANTRTIVGGGQPQPTARSCWLAPNYCTRRLSLASSTFSLSALTTSSVVNSGAASSLAYVTMVLKFYPFLLHFPPLRGKISLA